MILSANYFDQVVETLFLAFPAADGRDLGVVANVLARIAEREVRAQVEWHRAGWLDATRRLLADERRRWLERLAERVCTS